jgi:hypothetical protein
MLTILAGVATWEREIMLERQREGIAKAKAAGKYKGRPVSIDAAQIRQLRAELGPAAIAKRLGIARSSVYRGLVAISVGQHDSTGGAWLVARMGPIAWGNSANLPISSEKKRRATCQIGYSPAALPGS